MWYIIKAILDKNGSPAWNRISNLFGAVQGATNSAKTGYNYAKGLWNKYNTGE